MSGRHQVSFEVVVPDDDEGHSLGTFYAPGVPRAGDRFCVPGHPDVCRGEHDEFIGVVTEVVWIARRNGSDDPSRVYRVDAVVHVQEEYQAAVVFCTCTPEEVARTALALGPPRQSSVGEGWFAGTDRLGQKRDEECGNCGKRLRDDR
jgi:hypothetical protein